MTADRAGSHGAPTRRIRPRVFAFALGFLLLAELVLRAGLLPVFPADFRLPSRTLMGYDEFVTRMRDSERVRVAVIGDSVVAGQFATRADTLSTHLDSLLAEEGRPADAYNLGLAGAQAVDLYALTADVLEEDAADIVVINMDYRFYGQGVPAPRYPELWERLDDTAAPAGLEPSVAPVPEDRTLAGYADRGLSSVWSVYAKREALAASVFGEIPRRELAEAAIRFRLAVTGNVRYPKKPDARLPLGDLKDAYDVPAFTESDPSIRYLGAAIDRCREHNVRVVVFAGPLDRALLDRHDIVDWERYDANIEWAREYCTSRGATFVEMTDALPAAQLGDSHHPLGPGYATMAGLLRELLAPTLDALGAPAGVTP
ncbi:MAG: hypothetical protein ACYC77_02930 [Coriobacteriia bacterium]